MQREDISKSQDNKTHKLTTQTSGFCGIGTSIKSFYFDENWNPIVQPNQNSESANNLQNKDITEINSNEYQFFDVKKGDKITNKIAITPSGTIYKIQIPYQNAESITKFDAKTGNFRNLTWYEKTIERNSVQIFDNDFYIGEKSSIFRFIEGQGIMTYANGDSYTGNFVNDKREGQGIMTYANGASYKGNFVNDKREGHGTLTYVNGASYTGNFVNNKREGHGTLRYASGASYTGEWKDGNFQGQGIMTYANGASYTGEWKNNITIPPVKSDKPQNTLYIILDSMDTDDLSLAQGTKYNRTKITEEGNIPGDLSKFITEKGKLKIEINTHGGSCGSIDNETKILQILYKIMEKVKGNDKIKQINLNLAVCYGSAWLEKTGFDKIQKIANDFNIPIKITASPKNMLMSANITNGKRLMPLSEEKGNHKTKINEFILTPKGFKNEEYVSKYIGKGYNNGQNSMARVKSWKDAEGFMKVPYGRIESQNEEWNKERTAKKFGGHGGLGLSVA
jgi:hypothetical protein